MEFGSNGTRKRRRLQKSWTILAACLVAGLLFLQYGLMVSSYTRSSSQHQRALEAQQSLPTCAINLFGLPRAFRSLVLPSLIQNVVSKNDCDYFVHYYFQTEEVAGRSGQGGTIDPNEILLLREAIQQHAKNTTREVHIEFTSDTEDRFWSQYTPLVEKIRTTKKEGEYYYFPWKARTYKHPTTTDNIIKMWHSIHSAWNLMERYENKQQPQHTKYETVAMLRSDVVYMTPIVVERHNPPDVTIPAFGRYPVSDRIIYGAHDAVRAWATARFSHLEEHVAWIYANDPGWGLHSERFVNYTIFPQIHVPIREHPTMCFLRARADESVWVTDCAGAAPPTVMENMGSNMKQRVETTLGRTCGQVKRLARPRTVKSLSCPLFTSAQ